MKRPCTILYYCQSGWGFITWLVDFWIWSLRNWCHWKVRDMPVPLREGKERDLAAGQLSQMAPILPIVLFLRCKMAVLWMWSHGPWTYKMTHGSWPQTSKVVMSSFPLTFLLPSEPCRIMFIRKYSLNSLGMSVTTSNPWLWLSFSFPWPFQRGPLDIGAAVGEAFWCLLVSW